MAKSGAGREEITVVLPLEPPELNPEAASVLLRILLKAYDKQCASDADGHTETCSAPKRDPKV
jgi:hypothetical protein